MPENLSNLSYVAGRREATKGTIAGIPNFFFNAFSCDLETTGNHDQATEMIGNKFKVFRTYKGQRSHQGSIEVLADPNTSARVFDMCMVKGTVSGSGPYTNAYTLGTTSMPASYTIEVGRGQLAERFMGFEAHTVGQSYDKNFMKYKLTGSALKSFTVREVSGIVGTTVTLKTNYDASPTDGLFASDIIRFTDATGASSADTTVASVTSGTVFEVASGTGITANDLLFLRAQPVTDVSQNPFDWARTEFQFAADATTAQAAAASARTPTDPGSEWTFVHEFLPNEGAMRSGSYDPAALVRGTGTFEVKFKRFFDTPDDWNRFITNQKRALVIKHVGDAVSATNQEVRITLNDVRVKDFKKQVQPGNIIFADITFEANYDLTDAQGFDVRVIHNTSGF